VFGKILKKAGPGTQSGAVRRVVLSFLCLTALCARLAHSADSSLTDTVLSVGIDSTDSAEVEPSGDRDSSFAFDTATHEDSASVQKADPAPLLPALQKSDRETSGKAARLRPDRRMQFVNVATALRMAAAKRLSALSSLLPSLRRHLKVIAVIVILLAVALATLLIYRQRLEQGRFMTTTRLSIMDKEVQRVCRHVEDHYADPSLDTETICSALVTGRAFIEALFVKELGLTPQEFIDQVRINRAKLLLRKEPHATAGSIASAVGFGPQEQRLLTLFKTITGMSMEEYRSALRDDRSGGKT